MSSAINDPSSPTMITSRSRKAEQGRLQARSQVRERWVHKRAAELRDSGALEADAWRQAYSEADSIRLV